MENANTASDVFNGNSAWNVPGIPGYPHAVFVEDCNFFVTFTLNIQPSEAGNYKNKLNGFADKSMEG